MVCKRFNVLFEIIKKHGHDLQPDFRKEHKKWQLTLSKLHENLINWEMENLGK